MTVIPDEDAILVADPAAGFGISNFRNTQQPSLSATGQIGLCWGTYSKETGNYYLTRLALASASPIDNFIQDLSTFTIIEVNVDSNLNGTVGSQYLEAHGSATDIANINGKDWDAVSDCLFARARPSRFSSSASGMLSSKWVLNLVFYSVIISRESVT
ncbi:hypothetical protein BU17DRAFT_65587 [Hysterangium stoloniferum]|nr:hypothetical protein BU17DRAFT_65587 [Hysterangium stoloniferum]